MLPNYCREEQEKALSEVARETEDKQKKKRKKKKKTKENRATDISPGGKSTKAESSLVEGEVRIQKPSQTEVGSAIKNLSAEGKIKKKKRCVGSAGKQTSALNIKMSPEVVSGDTKKKKTKNLKVEAAAGVAHSLSVSAAEAKQPPYEKGETPDLSSKCSEKKKRKKFMLAQEAACSTAMSEIPSSENRGSLIETPTKIGSSQRKCSHETQQKQNKRRKLSPAVDQETGLEVPYTVDSDMVLKSAAPVSDVGKPGVANVPGSTQTKKQSASPSKTVKTIKSQKDKAKDKDRVQGVQKKKKQKHKKNKQSMLSAERLKAYGIHPKKFKYTQSKKQHGKGAK